MWKNQIKEYYLKGLYTDDNLYTFVKAKMISEDDMNEIKNSVGADTTIK